MNRRKLLTVAVLLSLALSAAEPSFAMAGEPGPGLEIFNSDGSVDVYPNSDGQAPSPGVCLGELHRRAEPGDRAGFDGLIGELFPIRGREPQRFSWFDRRSRSRNVSFFPM